MLAKDQESIEKKLYHKSFLYVFEILCSNLVYCYYNDLLNG